MSDEFLTNYKNNYGVATNTNRQSVKIPQTLRLSPTQTNKLER